MNEQWINIGKAAVKLLIAGAVNSVVMNGIKATTPKDVTLLNRASIAVGGFCLSMWITDQVSDHVVNQVDSIFSKKPDGVINEQN